MAKSMREQLTKKVVYRKNVNDQWEARIAMKDGFQYSVAIKGNARVAKAEAREKLLDKIMMSAHPLPL